MNFSAAIKKVSAKIKSAVASEETFNATMRCYASPKKGVLGINSRIQWEFITCLMVKGLVKGQSHPLPRGLYRPYAGYEGRSPVDVLMPDGARARSQRTLRMFRATAATRFCTTRCAHALTVPGSRHHVLASAWFPLIGQRTGSGQVY